MTRIGSAELNALWTDCWSSAVLFLLAPITLCCNDYRYTVRRKDGDYVHIRTRPRFEPFQSLKASPARPFGKRRQSSASPSETIRSISPLSAIHCRSRSAGSPSRHRRSRRSHRRRERSPKCLQPTRQGLFRRLCKCDFGSVDGNSQTKGPGL